MARFSFGLPCGARIILLNFAGALLIYFLMPGCLIRLREQDSEISRGDSRITTISSFEIELSTEWLVDTWLLKPGKGNCFDCTGLAVAGKKWWLWPERADGGSGKTSCPRKSTTPGKSDCWTYPSFDGGLSGISCSTSFSIWMSSSPSACPRLASSNLCVYFIPKSSYLLN